MAYRKRRSPAKLKYRSRRKAVYRAKKRLHARQSRKPMQMIHWHGSPMPREYVTTFSYAADVTVPVITGNPATQQFSMNSLWDPDYTGLGGNSVRYFGTMCGANNSHAPYGAYVVYASKIKIIATTTPTVDSINMRALVGLAALSPTATAASTLSEMFTRADYKNKFLGYWSSGQSVVRMSRFQKIAPLLGAAKLSDKTGCQAAYNQSPTNQPIWAITFAPIDQAMTFTYRVIARITYYTKLYSRNDVADS